MATDIVYLNGEFMPIDQARLPVLDRGFIFGDGVYEVVPAYSRHPFRLAEHLKRLQNSLDGIRLANPLTDAEWTRLTHEVIKRNDGDDQSIYYQVTRGAATRAHDVFADLGLGIIGTLFHATVFVDFENALDLVVIQKAQDRNGTATNINGATTADLEDKDFDWKRALGAIDAYAVKPRADGQKDGIARGLRDLL